MSLLKTEIAIRILSSLGVVGNDMNDIRNKLFIINYKDENIYSGKINYTNEESLVFLYFEVLDSKYMMSFLEKKNITSESALCIISINTESHDPDLTKLIIGSNNKFREASYLECAKFLSTFEIVKNHMPNWVPNEPKKEQIEYLFKFIDSISTD